MTNLEKALKDFLKTEDIRITTQIARNYGGCTEGWRNFCILNALDFKEFLREGILASALLRTNDENARKLVYFAYTGQRL